MRHASRNMFGWSGALSNLFLGILGNDDFIRFPVDSRVVPQRELVLSTMENPTMIKVSRESPDFMVMMRFANPGGTKAVGFWRLWRPCTISNRDSHYEHFDSILGDASLCPYNKYKSNATSRRYWGPKFAWFVFTFVLDTRRMTPTNRTPGASCT
jgi:hypothetical protein